MSYTIDTLREVDVAEIPPGTLVSLNKQFKVIERLGEGGMGKVFKAFDPIMNRYVALKVMKTDVPDSEKRRFRLEARLCGSFQHPYLPRIMDVGTTREHGLFWFTMEFYEGRDLSQYILDGRAVPLPVLCEIMSNILDGLRYVHLRRVVHRDIKPANIFVTRDTIDPQLRQSKLLDFGVARDLADEAPEDGNLILGDPAYLAPEQAVPNGPLDGRADLYALGVTFFEAASGQHPWHHHFEEHPRELIGAHRGEERPQLTSVLPRNVSAPLADALDTFFQRACAVEPDQRFADANAMKQALVEIEALAVS